MDHRCLYGHRVPASFTFAIQSRSCPTCGAATVTLVGYQAARRLATEAGMEAVAAFHAVRVLEGEFTLVPNVGATAPKAAPPPATLAAEEEEAPRPAAAVAAAAASEPAVAVAPPHEEEEVVVDEETVDPGAVVAPVVDAVAAPEPRVKITPKKKDEKKGEGRAFEPGEEDFFKGA